MKGARILAAVAVGAGALALTGAPSGYAGHDPGATILVKFKPGVDGTAVVKGKGDDPSGTLKTKVVVVRLKPGETVDEALGDYKGTAGVAYAEPDVTYAGALTEPNDPYFPQQWALARTDAVAGWTAYPGAYGATGGAAVAVVDSGIDATVPDLADGRVLTAAGADCLSGTCVPGPAADDNGHGTNVAGVLDGAADDGVGIAGAAFTSPVIPVKVLDSTASGTASSVASGIIWAADHGARVVNLSISGPFSQTICDAVDYASTAGALVVAAAGNNGWSAATYPAACPGVVGVAATDSTDAVPYWSNAGYPNVFVAAPGAAIVTTALGGGTTTVSGTSLAAPYVAALAAQLFSQDPLRTVAVVKTIIAETAQKIGAAGYGADPYSTCGSCTWSGTYGYGRIDVAAGLLWPGPGFSVSAAGSTPASVAPGGSASYAVSVGIDAGHTGEVALSVSGLPGGSAAVFSPASLGSSGSSQLTVRTSSSTPTGAYPLTITATDGTTSRTAAATLDVSAKDFSLSPSTSAVTVGRGKSTTLSLAVGSSGGYAGGVTLSVTGLPSGATAGLSPATVVAPGSSQLTLAAATTTPVGTYALTVTGTDGTTAHTVTVTLSVVAPDFTVSASPTAASIPRGQSTSYAVSVGSLGGYTGTIALSVSGYPSNASVSFSSSSVAAPGSATLTVKTSGSTVGGTYTLTVKGTSSTKVVRSATVMLTVIVPDFAVSAAPASTEILQGQTGTYSVAVAALNGFTGSIALSVSGYPSNTSVAFSPGSVAVPGGATLTVTTSGRTAVGAYTLTISGKSSSNVVRSTTVTLVVDPIGDFAMSLSASTITVKRGSSLTLYAYLNALNGFYANVDFSTGSLPAGVTTRWGRSYLLVYGTSRLSVSVKIAASTSAVPGTYTIDVIGTSGPLSHTVPLTVIVT